MRSLDPTLAGQAIQPLDAIVAEMTAQRRLNTLLLGGFGVVAALLAAIGLYGVMAHAVEQRTRELGVRLALGASGGGVMRLVIGEGLRLVLIGLGVGFDGGGAEQPAADTPALSRAGHRSRHARNHRRHDAGRRSYRLRSAGAASPPSRSGHGPSRRLTSLCRRPTHVQAVEVKDGVEDERVAACCFAAIHRVERKEQHLTLLHRDLDEIGAVRDVGAAAQQPETSSCGCEAKRRIVRGRRSAGMGGALPRP